MEIEYRGYVIEVRDEITVQFCGDDIPFPSITEAKEFIDEVV